MKKILLSVLSLGILSCGLLSAQTAANPLEREMRKSRPVDSERPGYGNRLPKTRGPRDHDPAWDGAGGSGDGSTASSSSGGGNSKGGHSSGSWTNFFHSPGSASGHRASGRQHYTTPEPSAYIELALVGAALGFYGWKRRRA